MSSPFSGNDNSALGAMSDPLNFVKNLWGGMQVPGMVTPTISVDELDKKIKDLKTVESWLNVNMTMLRGTIQALEVQRSTIATLKSMGETFAQQMSKSAEAAATATGETGASSATSANFGWPMPAAEASKKPLPEPETVTAATAAQPVSQAKPETKSAASADKTDAASASPFANAANLWNLLQDQFKQAVSSAMEGEQMILGASQPAESKTTAPRSAKSAVDGANKAAPAVKSTSKAKAKTTSTASSAKAKPAAKAPPAAAKPGRKRAAP